MDVNSSNNIDFIILYSKKEEILRFVNKCSYFLKPINKAYKNIDLSYKNGNCLLICVSKKNYWLFLKYWLIEYPLKGTYKGGNSCFLTNPHKAFDLLLELAKKNKKIINEL